MIDQCGAYPLFDRPLGEKCCVGSAGLVAEPPASAAIPVYHDRVGAGPVRGEQPLDSVDLDDHLR